MPTDSTQPLPYSAALNGLRGACIVVVMMSHTVIEFPSNAGPMGDLFFVLSGFLITTLLTRDETRTSPAALKRFYFRRIQRLLPCLLLVVAATQIAIYYLKLYPGIERATIAVTQSTNWARAFGVPTGFYSHLWALAATVQFYLLWPFVVMILERFLKAAALKAAVLGLIAITAIGYRLIVIGRWPTERIFFGLDTHADGLIVGGALAYAVAMVRRDGPIKPVISTAISYLAAPIAVLSLCHATSIPWKTEASLKLIALSGLAAAVIIFDITTGPKSIVGYILKQRWITWLGTISYGLFLWHFPVFYLCNSIDFEYSSHEFIPMKLALTFGFAILSYVTVERRFIRQEVLSPKVAAPSPRMA